MTANDVVGVSTSKRFIGNAVYGQFRLWFKCARFMKENSGSFLNSGSVA